MARLRAGERAAFDQVYAGCSARLYRFVARLTRSPDLAAEIVQETWLRFAQHARGLPEGLEPAAWLYRVARNLFLSHRRRDWLADRPLPEWLGWLAGARPVDSPFEELATSELQRELERAIAQLPLPQRELFLLVAIEGLEPSEAARVLGIAPEAARQRLSRARARLSASLDRAAQRGEHEVKEGTS